MGRGLAAILSVSGGEGEPLPLGRRDLRDLPVELIRPNPNQPRKRFDGDGLTALAASLTERGVVQPILVRPLAGGTYELVAGERRWRAAQLAGLETIPAIVRDHDDAATLELALIENMAREDLNPVEEARAIAALVEELGLTREAVGRRVGRSRVAISNLLRILDLPDDTLALIESGSLSEGHGRALLLASDHGARRSLGRTAAVEGWSVRVLEAKARAAAGAAASAEGRATPRVHPDQQAAADEITAALGAALGAEVRVRASGTGFKAELSFESADEAIAFARRVRPRAVT
jgi:ParB family chromosome partitioning protein